MRFQPGHKTWNKGMKGIHLSPGSEFKPGQTAGAKSRTWKGGVQTPVNDCTYLYDGPGKRIRRPKAVYEAAYGPVPPGMIVYHIDGDKDNDNHTNLEVITRGELLKRNLSKRS